MDTADRTSRESSMGDRTTDERPAGHGARTTGRSAALASRYTLGAVLGKGGMGEVIDAHDAQIGRDVAIKRMRADDPNDRQIARFMREARIQGRLEHPSIVPVHEVGRDGEGRPYFAMKKLAGITLAQILADDVGARDSVATLGRYSMQRLLRALSDVCLAVELAHTRGFVHRDLKPENIMLGHFGETYVLDWGVAKVTGEDDAELTAGLALIELETAQGSAVGTPGYMAPEQALGLRDIDGRADVYALGCLLFEILTGQRLHPRGPAGMQSAVKGLDCRPSARTPERDIPPELDQLCMAATMIDRDERVQTARDLGMRIQQFLDGDRDLALRRKLAHAHLQAANTAFAGDDRSRAMAEAGRALALDPTLEEASLLITRMIITPPRRMPAEVKRAFDAESMEVARRTVGVGALASASYLFFVPVLAALGAAWPYVLTMAGCSLASVLLLWWARQPGRAWVAWPVVLLHMVLIAVCARLYTPFLLGPGLAAVTAIGLMTGPHYAQRQPLLIAVVVCGAVLGPWLGEVLGLLSPTMTVEDGVMMVRSSALRDSTSAYLVLVPYTLFVVTSSVLLSRGLRRAERSARRSMHVQAWQLRQLVAGPRSG